MKPLACFPIMDSSLSSVPYAGLELSWLSFSMWLAVARSKYWVCGKGNIPCGSSCWAIHCHTSSSSYFLLLSCLSGLKAMPSLLLLRSVALSWQLCSSFSVSCTIAGWGKLDWQRWPGKETKQGPKQGFTRTQEWSGCYTLKLLADTYVQWHYETSSAGVAPCNRSVSWNFFELLLRDKFHEKCSVELLSISTVVTTIAVVIKARVLPCNTTLWNWSCSVLLCCCAYTVSFSQEFQCIITAWGQSKDLRCKFFFCRSCTCINYLCISYVVLLLVMLFKNAYMCKFSKLMTF